MRNKKIIQHWDITLIQLCLEELSYPSAVSPGFTGCHKCVENPCSHVVSFRESTEVDFNNALRASALLSGTFLGFGGTSLRGVLCAKMVMSCSPSFGVALAVLGVRHVLFATSKLMAMGSLRRKSIDLFSIFGVGRAERSLRLLVARGFSFTQLSSCKTDGAWREVVGP